MIDLFDHVGEGSLGTHRLFLSLAASSRFVPPFYHVRDFCPHGSKRPIIWSSHRLGPPCKPWFWRSEHAGRLRSTWKTPKIWASISMKCVVTSVGTAI